jgi:hypothetical protein
MTPVGFRIGTRRWNRGRKWWVVNRSRHMRGTVSSFFPLVVILICLMSPTMALARQSSWMPKLLTIDIIKHTALGQEVFSTELDSKRFATILLLFSWFIFDDRSSDWRQVTHEAWLSSALKPLK